MSSLSSIAQMRAEYIHAIEWSDRLFACLTSKGMYAQPIRLRHPCIFYYGHLPAFAWNHVFRYALGRKSLDQNFDHLFARGIDPPDDRTPMSLDEAWPSIERVAEYKARIETELFGLLAMISEDRCTDRLKTTLHMVLEHYLMHVETFIYILHQMDDSLKRPLLACEKQTETETVRQDRMEITPGWVVLGAARNTVPFGWCNEFGTIRTTAQRFFIDRLPVTNGEFLEFVQAGGYENADFWSDDGWHWVQAEGRRHPQFWVLDSGQWYLRRLFTISPLPENHPAWVSYSEARAYARWKGGQLPSEVQFHRAAYGSPTSDEESEFPWEDDSVSSEHGNFGLRRVQSAPVGSFPKGRSRFGVDELVGNGWEWTRSSFAPFPGFAAYENYPGYSSDFFDGRHFVLKGASPVTDTRLIRRSFRNWFQPHYPYMYAKFRCVYEDAA